ncbi:hypothetical protein O181_029402 [Austropuccinia psidii MF-1]|uniref:Uncharacterized protein n=1 Tax=Austropuccinia psidii MF-1 TaxID=1389203 RepID=A0A9Q3H3H3_9BASI|nr:hypothetical protein [Austropuccinia psidii MF-1]
MIHGGYSLKLGPEGLMAILGLMRFGAKIGSGGPNCGLGASRLPPLAPFGLIGLGQKGPNWPVDRDEPLMKRGGPEGLVLARGPKNKDKDLGVGDMEELAREAKDGGIWPEAIKGQGRVIWPKCHRAPEGAKLAIKIWCRQLAQTWSQVGIATKPMEEGHSSWL